MRKETLEQRAKLRNMPVPLRVTVTRETLLLVEGLAKQHELTVEGAVSQAISDWRVRWEASANRKTRLGVERALKEAKDLRSLDTILTDFRAQMQGATSEDKDSPEGFTSAPASAISASMSTKTEPSLRERREALDLSREKLARLADMSSAAIAQFEEGRRPKSSQALPRLEATLREQERLKAVAA